MLYGALISASAPLVPLSLAHLVRGPPKNAAVPLGRKKGVPPEEDGPLCSEPKLSNFKHPRFGDPAPSAQSQKLLGFLLRRLLTQAFRTPSTDRGRMSRS